MSLAAWAQVRGMPRWLGRPWVQIADGQTGGDYHNVKGGHW